MVLQKDSNTMLYRKDYKLCQSKFREYVMIITLEIINTVEVWGLELRY